MKRNAKMNILSFFIVIFCAFFALILEGNIAKAIDYDKTTSSKSNVTVQVNNGNRYFANKNKITVEVDASKNSDVNMFSIVICEEYSGICSDLDAKHRYTDLENGKATITDVSLSWIEEDNKKFTAEEGNYIIKVKPEKQTCTWIFCTPVTDIIEDENEENRYIETYLTYRGLNSSDILVNYNSVALSGEEGTIVDTPNFVVKINRYAEMFDEEITSMYVKYCLADNEWNSLNNKCNNQNLTLENGEVKLNLENKNLEGNYNLTIVAKSSYNDHQFSKTIKFIYDKTNPTVTISTPDETITKEKTFTYTIVDNSTTKTKYLVKEAKEEAPVYDDFKQFATSNQITVSDLSGEFILWTCTTDSSNNYTIASSLPFQLDNSAPIIEEFNHYLDFYNKTLVIQVNKISDQVKEGITYFTSIDGINYQESTSNLIKVDISPVFEEKQIKVYLYAKDALGNFDVKTAKEIIPNIESSEIELNIKDAKENNYYNDEVTIEALGNDIISIKVNSFEYINNKYFCNQIMSNDDTSERTILGYTCKFATNGVYEVVVKNASEETSSLDFIINKEGILNIDGIETELKEMFLVKVVSEKNVFYGSMPLSVFDLKKDIKLVYLDKNNTYHHLDLLEGQEFISLNQITDSQRFVLPIDVLGYQKANELKETKAYYFLAYSTVVERENNNVTVEIPEEPSNDENNPVTPDSHPVGEIAEKDDSFSIKDIFTFKNILLVAIIVIVIIYLLRFFVYKKNIQTV